MADNFYAPPAADLGVDRAGEQPHFYMVSQRKFLLLLMGTTGLYLVYWAWRNWNTWRLATGEDLWAVPRALFMIFFTHSLLRKVDQRIKRRGLIHVWTPDATATTVVVLMLIHRVTDQLAIRDIGVPYTLLLSGVLLFFIGVNLLPAQKAINLAEGDIHGVANNALTGANIAWLVAGTLLWILALAGVFGLLPDPPPPPAPV